MNIESITYLDGYMRHPADGRQVTSIAASEETVAAIACDLQKPDAIIVTLTNGAEVVYPFQRFALILARQPSEPQPTTSVQSVTDVAGTGNAVVEVPRRRRRRRTKSPR